MRKMATLWVFAVASLPFAAGCRSEMEKKPAETAQYSLKDQDRCYGTASFPGYVAPVAKSDDKSPKAENSGFYLLSIKPKARKTK